MCVLMLSLLEKENLGIFYYLTYVNQLTCTCSYSHFNTRDDTTSFNGTIIMRKKGTIDDFDSNSEEEKEFGNSQLFYCRTYCRFESLVWHIHHHHVRLEQHWQDSLLVDFVPDSYVNWQARGNDIPIPNSPNNHSIQGKQQESQPEPSYPACSCFPMMRTLESIPFSNKLYSDDSVCMVLVHYCMYVH